MTDPAVDLANPIGSVQRELDVRIHPARGVELADPVELRGDTERLEGPEEDLPYEVPGVVGRAATFRRGHAGKWRTHVAVDGIGCELGLGVHRVHVVDAVEERRGHTRCLQRAMDGVVEYDPTQRSDMDRPRRGFGIVDDLRSADGSGEFVGPIHGGALADFEDLVREVAGRNVDDDRIALVLAQQGAADR